MLENSRAKLAKKHIDMIVANNLKVEGAGFGTDTNVVTLITRDSETELPIMAKEEVADCLLTEILKGQKNRTEFRDKAADGPADTYKNHSIQIAE